LTVRCASASVATRVARAAEGCGMTDQQIWNVISWLGNALAVAVFIGWWSKSQLTSREIKGLKAENDSLKAQSAASNERRLLAEEQHKITADKLAAVEARLVTAQDQLKAHASAEAIAGTITVIQSSTSAAISSNNEIGRYLKADPPDVRLYRAKDFNNLLTKKSNE
jgi:signal transduction histidine kinase